MSGIQVKALTSIMFLDKTLHPKHCHSLPREHYRLQCDFFFYSQTPQFSSRAYHHQFQGKYQKWMSRKLNLSNTSKIAIENKNQP